VINPLAAICAANDADFWAKRAGKPSRRVIKVVGRKSRAWREDGVQTSEVGDLVRGVGLIVILVFEGRLREIRLLTKRLSKGFEKGSPPKISLVFKQVFAMYEGAAIV